MTFKTNPEALWYGVRHRLEQSDCVPYNIH